jgi:hypothetical protein
MTSIVMFIYKSYEDDISSLDNDILTLKLLYLSVKTPTILKSVNKYHVIFCYTCLEKFCCVCTVSDRQSDVSSFNIFNRCQMKNLH